MSVKHVLCVFLIIIYHCLYTKAELKSPCPNVFLYQTRDDSTDRWYGLFNLAINEYTFGVELKFFLDKPALELGNLFGPAITYDLKQFSITNKHISLAANSSHLVRLYVAYNPAKTAPALVSIEQNGKQICPDIETSTDANVFVSVVVQPTDLTRPPPKLPPVDDVNKMECGTIAAQASALIAGGEKSDAGEFPWQAAIYIKRDGIYTLLCGGTLVSRLIIATESRCLHISRSYTEDLRVHLGKQYADETGPHVQIHSVSERILHPLYKPARSLYYHNIGLLKLAEPATFNDFVRPVCLNFPGATFDNLVGKVGTMPGWGFTEVNQVSKELRYASMKVISYKNCLEKSSSYYLSTNNFCAESVRGSLPCRGDGGGGLVFPDESTGRTKYYLRGIDSHGDTHCTVTTRKRYEVFIDITEYLNFIEAHIISAGIAF